MERLSTHSLQQDLLAERPDGYYEDKLERICAGETVWLRRTFDGGGLCVDLISGREHLGYVVSDYDNPNRPAAGFTAVAYVIEATGPQPLDVEDTQNPMPPELAAFHLLQYCRRRGLVQND